MPKRSYVAANGYRYGFNGQEMSNDIKGLGNSYGAEFWEYDSRIGRRWNIDPVIKHFESPYAAFSNNPITRGDTHGDTDSSKNLSAAQLLDALKIGYNVVKNRMDAKKFSIGNNYSGEVDQAVLKYWENNQKTMNFAAYAEFRQQALDYYKGFAEVGESPNGPALMASFGTKILTNENVVTTQKIVIAQTLIQENNGAAGGFGFGGVKAFTIVMGLATTNPGNGIRGPRITSLTQTAIVEAGSNIVRINPYRLTMTHSLTLSRTQYAALKADIRAHGIRESIKYVERGGVRYVVDGHHRLRIAKELGLENVPIERVQLPYGGYKTTIDLQFTNY